MSGCKACNASTVPQSNNCGTASSTSGDCSSLDDNGFPVTSSTSSNSSSCVEINGVISPNMEVCTYWDLTKNNDSALTSSTTEEQLNISGAVMNVYKMLGIHEQQALVDATGNGSAISSGDLSNFSSKQAFTANLATEWRSSNVGNSVIGKSYIGYDFGNIKLSNGREKYGVETAIKKDIASIKIQQGCNVNNRVTKVRVERSNDGQTWFGVAILDVPDCDGLVSLAFNRSVPSRYWRLRPITFNGGASDWWSIIALQFSEYEKTNVYNIQDRILLENRDRDYQNPPLSMKCIYTPIDIQSNAAKWGFFQQDVFTLQVSFAQSIKMLGRPFAVGDIVELPSEAFPTYNNVSVKKYLMIKDVAWYTGSYTASWVPTMLRLLAEPAMASPETQQIFGKLTEDKDATGLSDIDDGNAPAYQDITAISDTIMAKANDLVPERGEDKTGLTQFSPEAFEYAKEKGFRLGKLKSKGSVISHDAMPPNDKPYTQGDEFPDNPKSGDYHRLTYVKYGDDIPPRLYKYSTRVEGGQGAWIPLDIDRRFEFRKTRPMVQQFLDPNSVPLGDDEP